jgi:acetolactate synthase-1/2/3 large subunit
MAAEHTDVRADAWMEWGSDVIVELLDAHGVDLVTFNPGATFRGIHDSLVNGPTGPRLVLCTHEAIAVAVAHGFAKAAGRPAATLLHDVVGLQLGSMAVYNAWCDRVPLLVLGGTGPLSVNERRPWIDWIHTANIQAQVVRDFVKWDDQPADLASVPESLRRAFVTTVSEPPGPVYVCFDISIQEQEVSDDLLSHADLGEVLPVPTAPSADRASLAEVAALLRTAESPVILTDYAGATREGFTALTEVARQTEAAVIDLGARFNLDTHDPRNLTGLRDEVLGEADVVIAIDVEDVYGALLGPIAVGTTSGVRLRTDVTVINVTPQHLRLRAWSQDAQRAVPVAAHVTSTAASFLEGLRAELTSHPVDESLLLRRRGRSGDRNRDARARWAAAAAAMETEPAGIPLAVIARELGPLIEDLDWTIVNGTLGGWERRLWHLREFGHHLGWHGGGGLGYGLGASIGAALHLAPDRLCIDLQADGDLLYTPSALWTLANQRIPLLVIVLDNGQYGNTVGHAQEIALHRDRDVSRRHVGAGLDDPRTDFAALAASFGVASSGPVATVDELVPALREALRTVQDGRPALVQVRVPGL